mmetsp:Transcript_34841/g.26008  ORF Transcript_34841/g.26008 Transcript_34841/m.26008 type:complete len:165 (-) Transcript_34841:678-1172(-)
MTWISSKPPKVINDRKLMQFMIDCEGTQEDSGLQATLEELKKMSREVKMEATTEVPWFPHNLDDLDCIGRKLLGPGDGIVDVDHPGFHDKEYRQRRALIAEISNSYSIKDRDIPRVEYTPNENLAWKLAFERLEGLHKSFACREFNWTIEQFKKHVGFSDKEIP